MFSMNEGQHTQVDHVPRRAVVVAHEVESHGDVGMAVIKAQVVLQQNTLLVLQYMTTTTHMPAKMRVKPPGTAYRSAFVLLRRVMHCFVPCSSTVATDLVHIKFPIPAL